MGHRGNGAFTGALLLTAGTILGAGVALALAPQSGKDTRKDIFRYGKKARKEAEDFADTVSGMVDAVGDKAEDILEKGKDLAYDAKKELIGAIAEGQKKLGKQRTRLEKLIA
jgi:gas vesicle protein